MPARRVLHVAQPTTAGVARVVADLVRDQVRRGYDVAVACPADGWLADEVRRVGARWLPWSARRQPGPSTATEAARLRAVVRAVAPDVLHLHSSKAGLAGRLAVRGRIPTIFQPHAWSFLAVTGPMAGASAWWERVGARWATALAVVSDDERRLGEAAGVRGRYVRVRNGVDLRQFWYADAEAAANARAELGLPQAPTVVCVGRLSRQKGQDLLLDLWPAVRAAVPTAQLVLVGDGPDRAQLAARAAEGTRLVGDRTDVPAWLVASDLVVLPSRWEAGLSLVAMEAMATGRSVVTTDVAGAREGVGEAGAVVPVDDARALAAAVIARLSDPARTAAEGAAARRHVEREHDLSSTVGDVAALYDDLLAGR